MPVLQPFVAPYGKSESIMPSFLQEEAGSDAECTPEPCCEQLAPAVLVKSEWHEFWQQRGVSSPNSPLPPLPISLLQAVQVEFHIVPDVFAHMPCMLLAGQTSNMTLLRNHSRNSPALES